MPQKTFPDTLNFNERQFKKFNWVHLCCHINGVQHCIASNCGLGVYFQQETFYPGHYTIPALIKIPVETVKLARSFFQVEFLSYPAICWCPYVCALIPCTLLNQLSCTPNTICVHTVQLAWWQPPIDQLFFYFTMPPPVCKSNHNSRQHSAQAIIWATFQMQPNPWKTAITLKIQLSMCH